MQFNYIFTFNVSYFNCQANILVSKKAGSVLNCGRQHLEGKSIGVRFLYLNVTDFYVKR